MDSDICDLSFCWDCGNEQKYVWNNQPWWGEADMWIFYHHGCVHSLTHTSKSPTSQRICVVQNCWSNLQVCSYIFRMSPSWFDVSETLVVWYYIVGLFALTTINLPSIPPITRRFVGGRWMPKKSPSVESPVVGTGPTWRPCRWPRSRPFLPSPGGRRHPKGITHIWGWLGRPKSWDT